MSVSGKTLTAQKAGNISLAIHGTSSGHDKTVALELKAVPAEGITMKDSNDNTSSSINVNDNVTLKATITPPNTTNKTVTWTVSDSSKVVFVESGTEKASITSQSGDDVTVKGKVAGGPYTITAKTSDTTNLSATYSLTVIDPITNLTLSKDQTTLQKRWK